MTTGSSPSPQRRVLFVNLDFRDFVYSHLWGRAVLAGCARRRLPVDLVAVHPFVGRDLAGELGVTQSALVAQGAETVTYLDQPDELKYRAVIGQLLDRQRYDTLILNCEAALFMHLMLDRQRDFAGTRWLVYDRHLHIDLRAHERDPHLRARMIASGMHLFTLQEIALGADRVIDPHADVEAACGIIRSFKRLGLTMATIHLEKWPLDDAFFAPRPEAVRPDQFVVFSGGDSGRDYETLFKAIHGLPIQLRLCAGRYPTPIPSNVTILPRLALHQFRDEVARATVVVVPLTLEPPVSGITVTAIAKMMGKPLIATENPVVRMHVPSHGDGGFLTRAGDVAMLRALLTQLIEAPAERERLGRVARVQAARDLSLRAFAERLLACDERATGESYADAAEPAPIVTTPAAARFRIAAQCAAGMRIDTPPADGADPTGWLRERVDAFCVEGIRGPLYVFIRQPPDRALGEALRSIVADHRVEPAIIAAGALSRAYLELLRQTGVRSLYVTLYGATPGVHDARAGEPGSWRRALALLVTVPRLFERVRVGVHFALSNESARELTGVLQVVRRTSASELLLWDSASGDLDVVGLEAGPALQALDAALNTAQRLGVRVRPVGFERTREVANLPNRAPCLLSAAVSDLLRQRIPLPSASTGVLATDGQTASIVDAAPTGAALRQLTAELAASGVPVLDMPACLGGPPPEARAPSSGVKVDACRRCPIDLRCAGVPRPLMDIPGLRDEIQPPRHWTRMPRDVRVAVLCPPVYDKIYGAQYFGVTRGLAQLGAHVDVVTPWAIHADFSGACSDAQRMGRPDGADELERFIAAGPVERYDLIVTPDPLITHPLVVARRLRPDTRLAITDFHMLGGMDLWVRDLCASGRRAEEGGWWPSDQIILYSGFPGYGWLYTRYGVPMRQVAWQPYALDPACFRNVRPVTEGTSIVSGGNHRRDLETLLVAAGRLGRDVHPIDLFASVPVPNVPPQIRFGGVVPTSTFCEVVGRSRFMVVPLLADEHHAAGVTAMVTAIMCGRPVVVTDTTAARDYVVDGVNGLLVPAGDPQAMAAAIERLDTDPELLTTLAAGARAAAGKHTTEVWARALLDGSRTYEADHWMWTKWRRPS